MKEFIYSNYGFKVEQLYLVQEKCFFYINNQKIKIILTNYDEEFLIKIYNISNYLYENNVKVNTFLNNVFGKIYTEKYKKKIVLLKENKIEEKITLEYINTFNNINNQLLEYNLFEEWKKEIDHIEEKLLDYNKEYIIIQNSINYFVGLAENAISALNNINIEQYKNKLTLGHKISYDEYTISNFDNPFYFIKTHFMYDIANYFKYNFLKGDIDYSELDIFLKGKLDETDQIVFFAVLLYPNYYLDYILKIINKENIINEKNIINERNIIQKIKNYENFLLYCKIRLKNVKLKHLITWINE